MSGYNDRGGNRDRGGNQDRGGYRDRGGYQDRGGRDHQRRDRSRSPGRDGAPREDRFREPRKPMSPQLLLITYLKKRWRRRRRQRQRWLPRKHPRRCSAIKPSPVTKRCPYSRRRSTSALSRPPSSRHGWRKSHGAGESSHH